MLCQLSYISVRGFRPHKLPFGRKRSNVFIWHRMRGATSRSPKCGEAPACGILLPSGGAEAPPIRKEGGKEKEWRCRVCPCTPTLSHLFLLLHFVVQHHLISAFTYGAYSSFIAHSFSGQYRQFLAKGHSRRSALDIQRDTVDVLTPKCRAIALMRQPHSKYSLKYSTVCSFTLPPPPGRTSPAPRRTPPRCAAPSDAHTPPCLCV